MDGEGTHIAKYVESSRMEVAFNPWVLTIAQTTDVRTTKKHGFHDQDGHLRLLQSVPLFHLQAVSRVQVHTPSLLHNGRQAQPCLRLLAQSACPLADVVIGDIDL